MSKQTIFKALPVIILSSLLTVAIIYAWREPTQAPPAGNVPAPTPRGGIIMYSGPWNFDGTGLGTGPLRGWALCNGNNGTPNLSDRFVMGTNASGSLGATGGANFYSLTTAQLPSHRHSISPGGHHSHLLPTVRPGEHHHAAWGGGGHSPRASVHTSADGVHNHGGVTGATGGGAPIDNRPAFLQLAFIMKL